MRDDDIANHLRRELRQIGRQRSLAGLGRFENVIPQPRSDTEGIAKPDAGNTGVSKTSFAIIMGELHAMRVMLCALVATHPEGRKLQAQFAAESAWTAAQMQLNAEPLLSTGAFRLASERWTRDLEKVLESSKPPTP